MYDEYVLETLQNKAVRVAYKKVSAFSVKVLCSDAQIFSFYFVNA